MPLLASLSMWALIPLWLALYGGWALVVRRLLRRGLDESERARASVIAAPLMPSLGAVFALLAALSLAGTAGELRATEDQVSAEAAQASRLAWSATGPGVDTARVHEALVAYLETTRATEWSGPGHAGSRETLEAVAELERRTRSDASSSDISTPHATELLAALDGITQARRQRLAAAQHDLPGFYLVVVAVAGLALTANTAALTAGDKRRLALLPAGLVTVVGLAMALLLALGSPFDGDFIASGEPLDQIVANLRSGVFQG